MDEMERAIVGNICDDAYVTNVLATVSEEHEVARLQFITLIDSLTLTVLLLRRTIQCDAEPTENIAGESRTIEG